MSDEPKFDHPCPKCGSTEILGLVASFWVRMSSDNEPESDWDKSVRSETDITEQRMCQQCDHEFAIEP